MYKKSEPAPQPRDFVMPASSIRPPRVNVDFEIRPDIIQLVSNLKFEGNEPEDPIAHLVTFLEICDLFRDERICGDALKLRLFPFSLKGRALDWLRAQPASSITSWDQLTRMFLNKVDILVRKAKTKNFFQLETESPYGAWERYKELLRQCPEQDLIPSLQLDIFYRGLNTRSRNMVDEAAGGSLRGGRVEEAFTLLDKLASVNHHLNNLEHQNNNQYPNTPVFDSQHPENTSKLEKLIDESIYKFETKFHNVEVHHQNQEAMIKRLESRIRQLEKRTLSHPQGSVWSNIEKNHDEAGKVLKHIAIKQKETYAEVVVEDKKGGERIRGVERSTKED